MDKSPVVVPRFKQGRQATGKFSETVSRGREQAAAEKAKKKAAEEKQEAERQAVLEAGQHWFDQVLSRTVDAANADLKNENLAIAWEPIPDATRPSVRLGIVAGGHPAGRSFTFIVDHSDISFHRGDGIPVDVGKVDTVNSVIISDLLADLLRDVASML